jgi:hypothetical protein
MFGKSIPIYGLQGKGEYGFSFSTAGSCVIIDFMIRKTVQKHRLDRDSEIRQNLQYWLSRTPEERLSAVEILRRQVYGNIQGLQRTVRVVKLSQS